MNPIISLNNVCKSFGNTMVLNDINLEVEEGEIVGIIGQNGCGKSVLYKIITGLIVPTSGRIVVNNKKIEKGRFAENIGIMFDNTGLLPNYTGFQNLKTIAVIENKINDDRIKEYISLVGLNPNDSKPVKKYSLGMKQRLKIAMAIMENPKILLLDEPFNALDKEMKQVVNNLLFNLNCKKKTTILITSHVDDDIKNLCTRVLKIKNGELDKV